MQGDIGLMTVSFPNDGLIQKCIEKIFVNDELRGYGVFVASNRLLTCTHLIFEDDFPEISSENKIRWGDQNLPAQVIGTAEGEVDLALLSVELTDHWYLLLHKDVVSFEALYIYR